MVRGADLSACQRPAWVPGLWPLPWPLRSQRLITYIMSLTYPTASWSTRRSLVTRRRYLSSSARPPRPDRKMATLLPVWPAPFSGQTGSRCTCGTRSARRAAGGRLSRPAGATLQDPAPVQRAESLSGWVTMRRRRGEPVVLRVRRPACADCSAAAWAPGLPVLCPGNPPCTRKDPQA